MIMKRKLPVIALALLLEAAPGAAWQDRDVRVKVGDNVPDFEVELVDGARVVMKELRGKVVLLNFWATWNPPCLEEFKRVETDILKRFEETDLYYVAISREDTREQVEAFREKTGYRFPMGLDPGREIFSLFAAASIPRDFVINREGKIVYMSSGYTETKFAGMVRQVAVLLDRE